MSILYSLRISVGFGGAPPWVASAPDLEVGAWARGADKRKSALSRRPDGRSSKQERSACGHG